MDSSLHNDNQQVLLEKVAAGDEQAFRKLFDRSWENIYNVALAFTKSHELSEEIVQDVFLKIWVRRDQLGAVERFDDYLFIIARNHIFNTLRKKIREQPFTEELKNYFLVTGDSPEGRLLYKESEQLVQRALEQLPPQQQKVWILSRQQGLSQEEIAIALQISRHTVKSHMSKALQSIRDYLRTHTDDVFFLVCLIRAFL